MTKSLEKELDAASQRLIGRDQELQQLLDAHHQLVLNANNNVHMVVVRGEQGTGKTKLLETFRNDLADASVERSTTEPVIVCGQLEDPLHSEQAETSSAAATPTKTPSFVALASAIHQWCHSILETKSSEELTHLRNTIRKAIETDEEPHNNTHLLLQVVPALKKLLTFGDDDDDNNDGSISSATATAANAENNTITNTVEDSEAAQTAHQITNQLQALSRCLESAANSSNNKHGQRGSILVVCLDDLQWCDADIMTWINSLLLPSNTTATSGEQEKLLLVTSYRDQEQQQTDTAQESLWMSKERLDDWLSRNSSATTLVQLNDFSLEVTHQYIASILQSETTLDDTQNLAQMAHNKSNGNVLRIQKLLLSLEQKGILKYNPAADKWEVDATRLHEEETMGNASKHNAASFDLPANGVQTLPSTLSLEQPAASPLEAQLAAARGQEDSGMDVSQRSRSTRSRRTAKGVLLQSARRKPSMSHSRNNNAVSEERVVVSAPVARAEGEKTTVAPPSSASKVSQNPMEPSSPRNKSISSATPPLPVAKAETNTSLGPLPVDEKVTEQKNIQTNESQEDSAFAGASLLQEEAKASEPSRAASSSSKSRVRTRMNASAPNIKFQTNFAPLKPQKTKQKNRSQMEQDDSLCSGNRRSSLNEIEKITSLEQEEKSATPPTCRKMKANKASMVQSDMTLDMTVHSLESYGGGGSISPSGVYGNTTGITLNSIRDQVQSEIKGDRQRRAKRQQELEALVREEISEANNMKSDTKVISGAAGESLETKKSSCTEQDAAKHTKAHKTQTLEQHQKVQEKLAKNRRGRADLAALRASANSTSNRSIQSSRSRSGSRSRRTRTGPPVTRRPSSVSTTTPSTPSQRARPKLQLPLQTPSKSPARAQQRKKREAARLRKRLSQSASVLEADDSLSVGASSVHSRRLLRRQREPETSPSITKSPGSKGLTKSPRKPRQRKLPSFTVPLSQDDQMASYSFQMIAAAASADHTGQIQDAKMMQMAGTGSVAGVNMRSMSLMTCATQTPIRKGRRSNHSSLILPSSANIMGMPTTTTMKELKQSYSRRRPNQRRSHQAARHRQHRASTSATTTTTTTTTSTTTLEGNTMTTTTTTTTSMSTTSSSALPNIRNGLSERCSLLFQQDNLESKKNNVISDDDDDYKDYHSYWSQVPSTPVVDKKSKYKALLKESGSNDSNEDPKCESPNDSNRQSSSPSSKQTSRQSPRAKVSIDPSIRNAARNRLLMESPRRQKVHEQRRLSTSSNNEGAISSLGLPLIETTTLKPPEEENCKKKDIGNTFSDDGDVLMPSQAANRNATALDTSAVATSTGSLGANCGLVMDQSSDDDEIYLEKSHQDTPVSDAQQVATSNDVEEGNKMYTMSKSANSMNVLAPSEPASDLNAVCTPCVSTTDFNPRNLVNSMNSIQDGGDDNTASNCGVAMAVASDAQAAETGILVNGVCGATEKETKEGSDLSLPTKRSTTPPLSPEEATAEATTPKAGNRTFIAVNVNDIKLKMLTPIEQSKSSSKRRHGKSSSSKPRGSGSRRRTKSGSMESSSHEASAKKKTKKKRRTSDQRSAPKSFLEEVAEVMNARSQLKNDRPKSGEESTSSKRRRSSRPSSRLDKSSRTRTEGEKKARSKTKKPSSSPLQKELLTSSSPVSPSASGETSPSQNAAAIASNAECSINTCTATAVEDIPGSTNPE